VAARTPDVSVVVASHGREDRLPILLDALAAQTVPRARWELVVAHTYVPDVAERVLGSHELARDGLLRQVPVDPLRARPSLQRNAALAVARGSLVAFTDDDCRPAADWLERLLERHDAEPGAIVQGATRADPLDLERIGSPLYVRTVWEPDPPGEFMQTCNILYPRQLVDRVGGFDEQAITGEDIDLALRARKAGAPLVGAPDALVYHAAEALTLGEKLRANEKWQHLAYVVRKHPELRERCTLRVFWTEEHARAALGLVGLVVAPRHRAALLALLPYYLLEATHFGEAPRARLRAIRRLPQLWFVQIAEVGVFIRGSLRYRTLLL
jgi:GT2 family glycosyltransferase